MTDDGEIRTRLKSKAGGRHRLPLIVGGRQVQWFGDVKIDMLVVEDVVVKVSV